MTGSTGSDLPCLLGDRMASTDRWPHFRISLHDRLTVAIGRKISERGIGLLGVPKSHHPDASHKDLTPAQSVVMAGRFESPLRNGP
jgi:hypothetical protein